MSKFRRLQESIYKEGVMSFKESEKLKALSITHKMYEKSGKDIILFEDEHNIFATFFYEENKYHYFVFCLVNEEESSKNDIKYEVISYMNIEDVKNLAKLNQKYGRVFQLYGVVKNQKFTRIFKTALMYKAFVSYYKSALLADEKEFHHEVKMWEFLSDDPDVEIDVIELNKFNTKLQPLIKGFSLKDKELSNNETLIHEKRYEQIKKLKASMNKKDFNQSGLKNEFQIAEQNRMILYSKTHQMRGFHIIYDEE